MEFSIPDSQVRYAELIACRPFRLGRPANSDSHLPAFDRKLWSAVVTESRLYLPHRQRDTGQILCRGVYLVFGKRSPDGQVDDEYKQRLEKAAELYHAQPRPLILVGGYTTLGKPSEAAAGLTELRRIGVPDNAKVYLEEASRHTLENLRNARELCATQQILISNRYHLARCSLIATSLGISHVLCAAEAELENSFSTHLKLIKESFFILWFRIGHGWAWLTNNRRMLDRIS